MPNPRATQAVFLSLSIFISMLPLVSASTDLQNAEENEGSSDPRDWLKFNPHKFQPARRLIPADSIAPKKARRYNNIPSFPNDPSRANIVFGRGRKNLPTAIYAKAYDVLQIGNKYFQAPGAGETKQIMVNGQPISIFGTTWYTPLGDNTYVGNPVQVSPFDPTKIFYKENNMWPIVIYGKPGQTITIANQQVTVPGEGNQLS